MTDDTTRLLEKLAETFPERPAPLPDLVRAAHAGRRRRTRRNVALAAGALVLAVVAGVSGQLLLPGGNERSTDRIADTAPDAPCDKQDPQPPSEPVPSGPDYPTNASGQTYGSARDNSRQPDLVAAIGDCGRTGYIERDALGEQPPWEPGAGALGLRSTPVYESDGLTRIDTFTQSPGTTVADGVTDPPAPAGGPDASDVEGDWAALIAGISSRSKEQYDTFRDVDLRITFYGSSVQVHDGCRDLGAGYSLEDGAFALTTPFEVEYRNEPGCERSAPLTAILENVRHVTQAGPRTYLHLEDFRIAVSLTPAG